MNPNRSQQLTQPVVEVFLSIEEEILLNIAKLLSQNKNLLDQTDDGESFDRWQAQKLAQLGTLTQRNMITIAKHSGLSVDAVSEALKQSGYETINEYEGTLQEAVKEGKLIKPPIPEESLALERVLVAFQGKAEEVFNLVNTTMLDQSQQLYLNILNESTGKVLTGTKTPRQALAEVAGEWAAEGVPALIKKNGDKMSTEAYVSMVTRSMSNNVANEMQLARMDEFGADLIEVSSHSGARPKCAKYQGKIFSLSGTDDRYPALSSTSYKEPDGLRGINCRHVFYPYVPSLSTKRYKPNDGKENREAYEQSQKQRYLERQIRKAKRKLAMIEELGDPEQIKAAKTKVRERQKIMRAFIDNTGRTRRYEREQTY